MRPSSGTASRGATRYTPLPGSSVIRGAPHDGPVEVGRTEDRLHGLLVLQAIAHQFPHPSDVRRTVVAVPDAVGAHDDRARDPEPRHGPDQVPHRVGAHRDAPLGRSARGQAEGDEHGVLPTHRSLDGRGGTRVALDDPEVRCAVEASGPADHRGERVSAPKGGVDERPTGGTGGTQNGDGGGGGASWQSSRAAQGRVDVFGVGAVREDGELLHPVGFQNLATGVDLWL